MDYVLDETDAGDDLRMAVTPPLVDAFFTSQQAWQHHVAVARHRSPRPLTAVVLDLLDSCAYEGWAMIDGRTEAIHWQVLHKLVRSLTVAEVHPSVTHPSATTGAARSRLTSVGLSQALGEIALLSVQADPAPAALGCGKNLFHRMELLGEVFWVIDDLTDLLEDDRRGHLNALLSAHSGSRLSDVHLYAMADQGAAQLAISVNRLGAGPLYDLALRIVALWTHTKTQVARAGRRPLPDRVRVAAIEATHFLLQAAERDYAGATHTLRMPRLQGPPETHEASLMLRSVVVDALLDASSAGIVVPPHALDGEVMAILRAKHPAVRGGWNYVPNVPELPPDIDDLGQVLQVLTRQGGADLSRTALEGARMAADAQDATGGINTWVIDARGDSAADKNVRAYLKVMGGWGVHPEVVANFALGLLAVDKVRWASPLRGMCRYLVSAQTPHGSWTSKWYEGPFYGTYRVVEVLAQMSLGRLALAKAERFLRGSQINNGWGPAGQDPLATALALLGLVAITGPDDPAVQAGTERLLDMRDAGGDWEARPWIVFPTIDGPVAYGSSTLTAAFGLKALCSTLGKA
jgi:squalene-hopene/tetraprenyl-beta-curcumene cyclase